MGILEARKCNIESNLKVFFQLESHHVVQLYNLDFLKKIYMANDLKAGCLPFVSLTFHLI